MSILKAMDVSSHQPRDLTQLIATHRPQHVIVKGSREIESPPQSHSLDQIQSAWNNGCSAGMYCWCYRSASPYTTIDDIIGLCASIGLELPLLWLDCETYVENGIIVDEGPNADWLAKAVEYSETKYGMKCGIYTGIWWIDQHFPGGQGEFAQFNRLPIWLSDYDGVQDINLVTLPIGWAQVAAKQYTATPVDLSVIREEYTVYYGDVTPPPPPPDPCENLKVQLQQWRDRKPYKPVTRRQLRTLDI
jgi:GH25 family lysozyme M1 (1,4-beta-N-acetylmuramidase)